MNPGEAPMGSGGESEAPQAPSAPEPPTPIAAEDAPGPGEPVAEIRRVPDSMARPPTERYPGGRPSPRQPREAEVWPLRPDPPAPRPTLRQRLWWVAPFGGSLLAGAAYLVVLVSIGGAEHPSFAGRAAFASTIVAVFVGLLLATAGDWSDGWAPTKTGDRRSWNYVPATCVVLFVVPATLYWIMSGVS